MAIKVEYEVKKNWMGDPCFPAGLAWDGVKCRTTSDNITRIISMWVLLACKNLHVLLLTLSLSYGQIVMQRPLQQQPAWGDIYQLHIAHGTWVFVSVLEISSAFYYLRRFFLFEMNGDHPFAINHCGKRQLHIGIIDAQQKFIFSSIFWQVISVLHLQNVVSHGSHLYHWWNVYSLDRLGQQINSIISSNHRITILIFFMKQEKYV